MPELRTDWLTGRAVLVAEDRALRPHDFLEAAVSTHAASGLPQGSAATVRTDCPFCVGNESHTPPAVYEKLDADGHWVLRVVPNRFPAVEQWSEDVSSVATLGSPAAEAALPPAASPSGASPVVGTHEVIIESPVHHEHLAALSPERIRQVVEAYVARLRRWRETPHLQYGLIFRNQGPNAGASLAHVHSQLITLPFIPVNVAAELDRAAQHNRQTGHCAYCERIAQERSAGERVVWDADGLFAYCPFVSLQPHEIWLLPFQHAPSFELASPTVLDRVSHVLHRLASRLDEVAPGVQHNLLVRTAPFHRENIAGFHWRIELLPRANALAGLEVATAVHINPLPPERAALQLRLGKVF